MENLFYGAMSAEYFYYTIIHSVRMAIADHVTPFSSQEASLMAYRVLSRFFVVDNLTDVRVDDVTYREQLVFDLLIL